MFKTTRYIIADDTFNDSVEKINTLRKAVDIAKLPSFEYTCYLRAELLATKPEMIPMLIDSGLRGAHFGIESMNNNTRKLIGRGVSIEKVIDAVSQLKSKSVKKIGTMGSLIVGLPNEEKEEYFEWKEQLEKNSKTFLDQWFFSGLLIMRRSIGDIVSFKGERNISSFQNQSPIEKDPEKFGYQIDEDFNSTIVNWKSKYMTYAESAELANKLTTTSWRYYSVGGWNVSAGWYFGVSEEDICSNSYVDFKKKCVEKEPRSNFWLNYVDNS